MRKFVPTVLPIIALLLIFTLACAVVSTTPTPTQTVITNMPDSSPAGMVLRDSPIQSTRVKVSESDPQEYSLVVTSTLPMGSSCSEFNGYEVKRVFSGLVDVQITHFEVDTSQVDQPVECTADLPIIETHIPLGIASDLEPGYAVKVNGEFSAQFLVQDPEGPKMTVAPAPVERISINESGSQPQQYRLNVVYTQPIGSSCSDFNGFEISRPSSNVFAVALTNLEVAEKNVPCTDDLPSGEVTILLGTVGTNLVAGQDYEVVVNGEKTDTFSAR